MTATLSPDQRYKLLVYDFDCGATTDFSLDVSLLRSNKKLPKHDHPEFLYTAYHYKPEAAGSQQNFAVIWHDTTHVTVAVPGLAHDFTAKRDDVLIEFIPFT